MDPIFAVAFILGSGIGWYIKPETECPPPLPPLTVYCSIKIPEKPVYPLTDNSTIQDNLFDKGKKALAEIELRKGYELKLEQEARSCNGSH